VDDYLPILILLILGFLFAALSFVASAMMAPKKRPTSAKIAPYECGIVPGIDPPTRFPVRFYLIAMIFIIFDIEIVFLYPWAVIFRQLRSFGLIEVVVFAAVVFISFLFLISNGALSWGPSKRLVGAMPSRTSESTIARISAGPGGSGQSTRSVGTGSLADPAAPAITDPDAPTTGEPATAPSGPGRAA
jgi:NADH-quinone oxidoreductase subunit A